MSKIKSFTRDRNNKQFSDIIQPVADLRVAGATTTAALTANTVYLYKFRVEDVFLAANAFFYLAATKAGTMGIGIYTFNGTSYDRVWHSGDYDVTTNGTINAVNTIPGAASATYLLVPGVDYWAAFGGTDATLTILRGASLVAAAAGLYKNLALNKASIYSAGLPSNITTASLVGATTPFIIGFTT